MRKVRNVQVRSTTAVALRGVSPLLLGNCSHLADISTEDLVLLSELSECRLTFEGETLYGQGEPVGPVYLLLDGALRLEHVDETGVTTGYEEVAPYATLGDMALLGEDSRRYTVVATRDSVVLAIPLRPLLEVLSKNSAAALAWRGAIMARLHRKESALAATFGWRILGKLAGLFEAA